MQVGKIFGYALWLQNYCVLFYLVSIASGKVFSIHEKLISGVLHAHNGVVFPQHLKNDSYFAAFTFFLRNFTLHSSAPQRINMGHL